MCRFVLVVKGVGIKPEVIERLLSPGLEADGPQPGHRFVTTSYVGRYLLFAGDSVCGKDGVGYMDVVAVVGIGISMIECHLTLFRMGR